MTSEQSQSLWPPCAAACPAGTDVRGYVQALAMGKYEEAFEIARGSNPFVSTCGRICAHPCESRCRRGSIEAPISSRALKRFVVEQTHDYRVRTRKRADITKTEKVAIIGAGPSGLTAAVDIIKSGYAVTVFEKEAGAGGMLRNAIPKYRLPDSVLQEDIDDIVALGIEIRCSRELGKDFTFNELRSQGFSAILLSIGLQLANSLPLDGLDTKGVHLALPLLRQFARGERPVLGDSVVVIGGGNVAVDVARSARRLGINKIRMVCIEAAHEVPASPWEIEEATEEGIELICSLGPKRILAADGRVEGMEFKKCLSVFNAEGRFCPVFGEDCLTVMECDSLVLSIGQRNDIGFAAQEGLGTTGPRLAFDPKTLATTTEGVFVTGEIATGPGAAIQAIATGHRAARAVMHYLETGCLTDVSAEPRNSIGPLFESTRSHIIPEARAEIVNLSPEMRVESFDPFEEPLSEEAAVREARRCLNCGTGAELITGKCASCLSCQRVCPFGVARVNGKAVFPQDGCVACGLCATECPAHAIIIRRFPQEMVEHDIERALQGRSDRTIVFDCLFKRSTRSSMESHEAVLIPCLAGLRTEHIMYAFEKDAESVLVKSCPDGNCRLSRSLPRLVKRIRRLQADLEAMGMAEKLVCEEY
ncbi:MAG: FAD-dependent oxidoreductase [Pseudomonadota bacterium]